MTFFPAFVRYTQIFNKSFTQNILDFFLILVYIIVVVSTRHSRVLILKTGGDGMELAVRKQKILKAIVESYISTGEPVGSKTLLCETGIEVSPATVRNDMADLTSGGYIHQPHTSAGRIPSQKGVRYYIDHLMTPVLPTERARSYIDLRLSGAADTPENLLREAAKLLSEYTGYAAVTTTPESTDARIHRIHLVGTGRHTAMIIMVTNTGMVRSKLFRSNFVVTQEFQSVLKEALNKALAGVPLSEINKPFMQTVAAGFSELFVIAPHSLAAIMEMAQQALITEICTYGETKLLFSDEVDPITSRNILSFLSDTPKVAKLLLSQRNRLSVQLGSECGSRELLTASVVTARYEISSSAAGAVGVFGSARMDYASAVGVTGYISECISRLLDEMVDI